MDTTAASRTGVVIERRRARRGAAVSLLCLVVSVAAMALLHIAQRGLDPLREPVSFYVHGEFGWLLPVALTFFGAAALTLSMTPPMPMRARRALSMFGAAMLVLSAVPSDPYFPWESRPTLAGVIHASTALVAPLFLFDVILSGRSQSAGRIRFLRRFFAGLYAAGLAGSAVSLVTGLLVGAAPPWIGVAERLLAFSAVAWLMLLLWETARS